MRIVSLVPSLTETVFALGVEPGDVVGRTAWCVAPPAVAPVRVVGGTKTPNLQAIIDLAPDLVLLEREENRRETYEALRTAGLSTWETHVTRVDDVPAMLADLGSAVGRPENGRRLARAASTAVQAARAEAAGLGPGPVALPLIWADPLMAVGRGRYAGDLVATAGFRVPDPEPGTGYPVVVPERIGALGVELLLISSEPYDFRLDQGEAIATAVAAAGFPRPRVAKVDGQALTWFGVRTAEALRWWMAFRRSRR